MDRGYRRVILLSEIKRGHRLETSSYVFHVGVLTSWQGSAGSNNYQGNFPGMPRGTQVRRFNTASKAPLTLYLRRSHSFSVGMSFRRADRFIVTKALGK